MIFTDLAKTADAMGYMLVPKGPGRDIATTEEVAIYLRKSVKTVYNWKSAKLFLPGIVLANGDFNMHKLRNAIKSKNAYLTTHLKKAA